MMAGNEFAVAAFVHPQLRRLADSVHAQTAALLAGVLGKAMPLWYALALVLILGAAFEHRPLSSGPGSFIALAAVLWGSDHCVYSNNARSDQQSNREDESGAPL
jgi:hypothetical protein